MSESGSEDALVIWVVYWNATDYPEKWVVRRNKVCRGDSREVEPVVRVAAEPDFVGDSLEAARESLPLGLHRLDRDPTDAPQIVEVWL